jgi:hypothetical protein
MDELEKEALEILRSAFRVDQSDNLNEFKTRLGQEGKLVGICTLFLPLAWFWRARWKSL